MPHVYGGEPFKATVRVFVAIRMPHVYGGEPGAGWSLIDIAARMPHVYGGEPVYSSYSYMVISVCPMYMGVNRICRGYVIR